MEQLIAYCGLDCKACEARIATINNDDALRRKVADEWSKLNNAEITPEMINCLGCRADGAKTVYCDSLCPIRQCALKKQVDTCCDCGKLDTCEKVAMVIRNNDQALQNLKSK